MSGRAGGSRQELLDKMELCDDSGDRGWERRSASIRGEYDIGRREAPWTQCVHRAAQGLPQRRLRGVPRRDRLMDILDVTWAIHVRETPKKLDKLWVDLSQNVDRRAWGIHPGTFTRGSLPYSFSADRVLTHVDMYAGLVCR